MESAEYALPAQFSAKHVDSRSNDIRAEFPLRPIQDVVTGLSLKYEKDPPVQNTPRIDRPNYELYYGDIALGVGAFDKLCEVFIKTSRA